MRDTLNINSEEKKAEEKKKGEMMNVSSLSQRYLKSNDTTNIDDQNQFVFNDDRITKDPCISLFEMPKNDCVPY